MPTNKGGYEMSAKLLELNRVITDMDESLLDELYKIVIDFVSRNDFDYFSEEDLEAIKRADEQRARGETIRFESAEEMANYFGVELTDKEREDIYGN
jgi:hypothetical protein